jgi:hypothetical protein
MDTRDRTSSSRWVVLGAAILSLGIVVQLLVTFNWLILPVGERIWEVRDKPAWERTGILSAWAGNERTAFLGFLRNGTPSDATVVFFEEHGLYKRPCPTKSILYPI